MFFPSPPPRYARDDGIGGLGGGESDVGGETRSFFTAKSWNHIIPKIWRNQWIPDLLASTAKKYAEIQFCRTYFKQTLVLIV